MPQNLLSRNKEFLKGNLQNHFQRNMLELGPEQPGRPHIGLEGLRCPGASPEGSLAQSSTCNLRLAGFSLLSQRGIKSLLGNHQEPAARPIMVLTSHFLSWPPP